MVDWKTVGVGMESLILNLCVTYLSLVTLYVVGLLAIAHHLVTLILAFSSSSLVLAAVEDEHGDTHVLGISSVRLSPDN